MDTIPDTELAAWSAAREQALERPDLALECAERDIVISSRSGGFWLDQSMLHDTLDTLADSVSLRRATMRFLCACEHLTRAASYEPMVTPDAYRKAIREWSRKADAYSIDNA